MKWTGKDTRPEFQAHFKFLSSALFFWILLLPLTIGFFHPYVLLRLCLLLILAIGSCLTIARLLVCRTQYCLLWQGFRQTQDVLHVFTTELQTPPFVLFIQLPLCIFLASYSGTSIPYLNTCTHTHFSHSAFFSPIFSSPHMTFVSRRPTNPFSSSNSLCLTNISSYLPHTEHAVNETLTFTFRYTPPFFPITNCPLQSLGRPIMPSSFLFQTSKLF